MKFKGGRSRHICSYFLAHTKKRALIHHDIEEAPTVGNEEQGSALQHHPIKQDSTVGDIHDNQGRPAGKDNVGAFSIPCET